MLTNIIYLTIFIILVFVLSIAVKAIAMGVEAKQIIKEEENSDLSEDNNKTKKAVEMKIPIFTKDDFISKFKI